VKRETVAGVSLPKVGFGTWKIGGGSSPDRASDRKSLAALESALALGYSHFDTAELYADGHTEQLLGKAIRGSGVRRESLLVTTKVKPEHLRYHEVLKACEGSLQRLGLEYVDLYLIHWPGRGVPLAESFRALNELVRDGKVRHIGVSNFDVSLLQESVELLESPMITNQVPYSLLDRSYVRNGVLAYCQANSILLTAYSPFEAGKLRNSGALAEIAKARAVSPHQIALAWLCLQRGVITIPMSRDTAHQRQNLEAADIALSDTEMAGLK
jgi:diketogulonate reductase-like aldo/keto reductase